MSRAVWIAISVHYFWRPLLHQPQSWPTPDLKTPVSRSESTIGTTVTIITGPITRTAPTGATWEHSTGVIFGALGVMTGLAMKIR